MWANGNCSAGGKGQRARTDNPGQLYLHEVLHADETTLQVLHEPGKKAQSKSYMWLYRTSGGVEHPIVLYEYQPDRKATYPEAFLQGFTGYLHADGYEGYHKVNCREAAGEDPLGASCPMASLWWGAGRICGASLMRR